MAIVWAPPGARPPNRGWGGSHSGIILLLLTWLAWFAVAQIDPQNPCAHHDLPEMSADFKTIANKQTYYVENIMAGRSDRYVEDLLEKTQLPCLGIYCMCCGWWTTNLCQHHSGLLLFEDGHLET